MRVTLSRRSWFGRVLPCCALVLTACQGSPTPPAGPAASGGTPRSIVLVRLGGAEASHEPPDKDILDGLKHGRLQEGTDFQLVTLDAGGDVAKVPALLDQAVKDKPAAVLVVHRETARGAAERVKDVPLLFYVTAVQPHTLGLSETPTKHPANVAGLYISLKQSLLVELAQGCVPKAESYGLIFDPGDPASVEVKDKLLADAQALTKPAKLEIAEAHNASEGAAAFARLAERKIGALILVPGRGLDHLALVEAANQAKIPVFGFTVEQAKAGAVLVRVPALRWGGFELGRLTARILKGQDPQSVTITEGPDYQTFINDVYSKQYGIRAPGYFSQAPKIH